MEEAHFLDAALSVLPNGTQIIWGLIHKDSSNKYLNMGALNTKILMKKS
jgi:hypothetical protein